MPTRAVERLTALVESDDATLDQLCAAIALIDSDRWTEAEVVDRLDSMADAIIHNETTLDSADDLLAGFFGTLNFGANRNDYYAPTNSLIHHALESRKAIPLTLGVIASEIGRRIDVPLSVVGMPGHALIGEGSDPQRWFDPFAAGRVLTADDCERIFNSLRPNARFHPAMLQPTSPMDIVARMLQNLRAAFLRVGDLGQFAAVLHLRTVLPAAPVEDRVELANVLALLGRDDQAADQRDLLIELQAERADEHAEAAARHRARRN